MMKLKLQIVFLAVLAIALTGILAACASGGGGAAVPTLGAPTPLQTSLNKLEPVEVAGKQVKFEFGGDAWISTADGKLFLGGAFQSQENDDGAVLTLKQTHAYSDKQKPAALGGGDIGWVKTPGPDITLEYKKGPPETMTKK